MNSRKWCVVAIMLLSLVGVPSVSRAADPVTSTVAIKAALQQVQEILSKLLIGADAVLASKIEAASNEANRLLGRVAELEKQANYDANELVNEVVRPLSRLMPEIRDLVTSTERRAFLDLNISMAGLMQTIDALPLTKVDPFVAAVDPARLSPVGTDRRVVIYGWFGKPHKKYPLKARIAGKAVTLQRVPGGYAFEIPPAVALAEEKYLPLEFDVPDVTSFIVFDWTDYATINDRIYVQKAQPYGCQYTAFLPNPDYEVVVDADQPYHVEARTQSNGGTPSNHRTVSSSDLFTATVSTSGQYEAASARLLDPGASQPYGASACQEHAPWSGGLVRWNADLVEFELKAPEIGGHQHSGVKNECWEVCPPKVLGWQPPCYKDCKDLPYLYVHGGGGSHANIDFRPRFSAVRKGATPALEQPPVSFRLFRSETKDFPLAFSGDRWRIHARCVYKDGDEKFDTGVLVLNPADVEEVGRDVSGRFADGKLYIQSLR
jgi:hypothetical protein